MTWSCIRGTECVPDEGGGLRVLALGFRCSRRARPGLGGREVLERWIRSSQIRIFDLSGVLGEARIVSALPGAVRRQESDTAWVIDLPSDF